MRRVIGGGLVCFMLLLCFIDCAGGNNERKEGIVLDRHYTPAETHYNVDSKGRTTTTRISEEYVVIVKTNGAAVEVETDMQTYYKCEYDERLTYHAHIGCLTGWNWGNSSTESDDVQAHLTW